MLATTERNAMRLNVHLDEELLARAMSATGLRTRKATIEEALRLLVQRREWAVAEGDRPKTGQDMRKSPAKAARK